MEKLWKRKFFFPYFVETLLGSSLFFYLMLSLLCSQSVTVVTVDWRCSAPEASLLPVSLTSVANYRRYRWQRWQTTADIVYTGGKLPPISLTPVTNYSRYGWNWWQTTDIFDTDGKLPPILLTPVANYRRYCRHRWQTTTDIIDTGGKLPPISLTNYCQWSWHRWQTTADIVDTGGKLPPISLTPVANYCRYRWQRWQTTADIVDTGRNLPPVCPHNLCKLEKMSQTRAFVPLIKLFMYDVVEIFNNVYNIEILNYLQGACKFWNIVLLLVNCWLELLQSSLCKSAKSTTNATLCDNSCWHSSLIFGTPVRRKSNKVLVDNLYCCV